MKKPFICDCGIATKEPFVVNGRWMCTLCAEEIRPGLVSSRAKRTWEDLHPRKREHGYGNRREYR